MRGLPPRRRDPIETGAITARTLVLDSLRLWMRVALPATLIMLAFGSVSILFGHHQPPLVRLFDAFVMVLATATIQSLAFARVVHGPDASVGEALNIVVRRYGSVWGVHFMVNCDLGHLRTAADRAGRDARLELHAQWGDGSQRRGECDEFA